MRGSNVKKLTTLLFYCCLVLCSIAQDGNFYFHPITSNHKLQGNTFSEVFVDSKGLAWIGSSNAVNVFNGTVVKPYKSEITEGLIGATYFNSFQEDQEQSIWFTSYEGIHLFDRATSHFHFFDLKEKDYRALCIDESNHLWLTSAKDSHFVHRFNIIIESGL